MERLRHQIHSHDNTGKEMSVHGVEGQHDNQPATISHMKPSQNQPPKKLTTRSERHHVKSWIKNLASRADGRLVNLSSLHNSARINHNHALYSVNTNVFVDGRMYHTCDDSHLINSTAHLNAHLNEVIITCNFYH